jgi:hypothetical protein
VDKLALKTIRGLPNATVIRWRNRLYDVVDSIPRTEIWPIKKFIGIKNDSGLICVVSDSKYENNCRISSTRVAVLTRRDPQRHPTMAYSVTSASRTSRSSNS